MLVKNNKQLKVRIDGELFDFDFGNREFAQEYVENYKYCMPDANIEILEI